MKTITLTDLKEEKTIRAALVTAPKKIACYVDAWENSELYKLDDCYSSYSPEKKQAFDDICEDCDLFGGQNLRILSFNIYRFITAYELNGLLIVDTCNRRFAVEL